jgi:hypothetical protein
MTTDEIDFESDAFLTVLTDALRAGPGSERWNEALQTLRSSGIRHANEYRLLLTARETLEKGRDYRSLRAGPEFTRELMENLAKEPIDGAGGLSSTAMIAAVSAAAMLVVLMLVGYLLFTAVDGSSNGEENPLLPNTVASLDFAGEIPATWQRVGTLKLEFLPNRFRAAEDLDANAKGGGIYYSTPIDPAEPFNVVSNVRITKPEDAFAAQVFISDDPTFDQGNSTTPHELVWSLKASRMQVILPDNRIVAESEIERNYRGVLSIRVNIDGPQATISVGDKTLWTGEHGLASAKPRHVGLRFLRENTIRAQDVTFQSLRINMRQP